MNASSASCKPSILIFPFARFLFDDPRHGIASDAMAMIDDCRSFLKCLQDEVDRTTESGDESEVRFLKAWIRDACVGKF